jgi:hypothetical protein
LPIPSFVGVLHEAVGSLFSGLSPVGQEKPSDPALQTTVASRLQPVIVVTPLLLVELPPLLPPLLPVLLPPLAVAEHPSSDPVPAPPTAAMASVNKNPLTVFQP